MISQLETLTSGRIARQVPAPVAGRVRAAERVPRAQGEARGPAAARAAGLGAAPAVQDRVAERLWARRDSSTVADGPVDSFDSDPSHAKAALSRTATASARATPTAIRSTRIAPRARTRRPLPRAGKVAMPTRPRPGSSDVLRAVRPVYDGHRENVPDSLPTDGHNNACELLLGLHVWHGTSGWIESTTCPAIQQGSSTWD